MEYLHPSSAAPPPDYQQDEPAILPDPHSHRQAAPCLPPDYRQVAGNSSPSHQQAMGLSESPLAQPIGESLGAEITSVCGSERGTAMGDHADVEVALVMEGELLIA